MKVITTNTAPTRRELAAEHLARLRERAAELDAKGAALMAERDGIAERIGKVALDAIVDEQHRPALVALRHRNAELPGLITATAAERQALDAEIAEAGAAVEIAGHEEAAAKVKELLPERERLAGEIDRALAKLATLWGQYRGAGQDLDDALGLLGFPRGTAAPYDNIALSAAAQHADRDLADAITSRIAWPNPSSMADGCDSDRVRESIGDVIARAA